MKRVENLKLAELKLPPKEMALEIEEKKAGIENGKEIIKIKLFHDLFFLILLKSFITQNKKCKSINLTVQPPKT